MTARRLPWILLVAAVLLFLFTPALLVVLFAFNATDSTSSFGGFSTRWFSAVFSNDEYMQALGNSAIAAFWTALFDVLAGTAAALALTRLPRRYLSVFSSLYLIPVMVPGLMLGVALLVFFSRLDLPLSMTTVVIGHILITLPLVILVIGARLERLDLSVLDAARDLGASGWTAFRRILLPLIAPALAGSALIAIAWSLDEFIVTLFTNGGTPTVPVLIFTLLRRGLDPSVNALAALLLGATMILGVITARLVSLRDLRR
jgi:ABC-type spermidine/putrescine transport system permease subunit II